MRKITYISGVIFIAAVVIFCFKIAGGREESPSYFKAAEENQIKGFGTDGNEFNFYSPFSPRSGEWQLQVMPNMGNRLVGDLYFTDSFTGYAVASPDIYIDPTHILKTTNGGKNWGYQIPDTSYSIYNYITIFGINNNIWCYDNYYNKGIYSSTGGDSTIYLGVRNISTEMPVKYELFQNYPNPFNSMTNFKF